MSAEKTPQGDDELETPSAPDEEIRHHEEVPEPGDDSGTETEPDSESTPVDEEDLGEAPALSLEEACASVEALLYASSDPLSTAAMKKAMRDAPELIPKALEALAERYGEAGRGIQLVEVAGGWQITTRPEYHERVARLFQAPRASRLSIQALETLAVIAYRQPVTVPEIVALRAVRSAGVVRTLLERKLIKILGRKKVVGHPLLYGTTKEFLVRFGLKNLKELPQLRDMSEVFGDEVAQHLEVLDTLDRAKEVVEIEPLGEGETAGETEDPEESAESAVEPEGAAEPAEPSEDVEPEPAKPVEPHEASE